MYYHIDFGGNGGIFIEPSAMSKWVFQGENMILLIINQMLETFGSLNMLKN